jgi:hypothetical protein
MAEARTRFRSDERTGIAAALAQAKFDRRRQEGMADIEYAAPVIQQLKNSRRIAAYGFYPKGSGLSIIQLNPGERSKLIRRQGARSEAVFAPATTERILEVYGNPEHPQYAPALAAALRQRPDIKEDPIFLAGSATPDTREESYNSVMHEATHRGFKNLGGEFGEGWLNAETEEFRFKYGIGKANVEEIIVRLIDNIHEGYNANSDIVIQRGALAAWPKKTKNGIKLDLIFPVRKTLQGSNLADQMLADPMVTELIDRLQSQADLQIQHEGRPRGETNSASKWAANREAAEQEAAARRAAQRAARRANSAKSRYGSIRREIVGQANRLAK